MTRTPTALDRSAEPGEQEVRALLFREEGWWVAQCLEYDLATQAKRLNDLFRELEKLLKRQVIVAHQTGRRPFANLPSAPGRFVDLWEQAPTLEPPKEGRLREDEPRQPKVQYRLADVA